MQQERAFELVKAALVNTASRDGSSDKGIRYEDIKLTDVIEYHKWERRGKTGNNLGFDSIDITTAFMGLEEAVQGEYPNAKEFFGITSDRADQVITVQDMVNEALSLAAQYEGPAEAMTAAATPVSRPVRGHGAG